MDLRTTQLLASRICHDLAGGISAISAGAELFADEGGALGADSLDLITASAQQTSSRLQFIRVAFGQGGGQAGGDGAKIALSALMALMRGLLEGGRVSLVFDGDDGDVPLGAGKLLLNLGLIGAEAMPRGGVLSVSVRHLGAQLGLAVLADGAGAVLSPDTQAAMRPDMDSDSLTVRTVNAYFTAKLAQNLGAELEISAQQGADVRLAALVPLA